jgi:hypothetical protein
MSTPVFTFIAATAAILFLYAFVMGVSWWHERKRHAH